MTIHEDLTNVPMWNIQKLNKKNHNVLETLVQEDAFLVSRYLKINILSKNYIITESDGWHGVKKYFQNQLIYFLWFLIWSYFMKEIRKLEMEYTMNINIWW